MKTLYFIYFQEFEWNRTQKVIQSVWVVRCGATDIDHLVKTSIVIRQCLIPWPIGGNL